MKVAFYKGPGKPWDWVVRIATFSKYSHAELIFGSGAWLSSSPRDGGVRYKMIDPKEGHWDFVDVPHWLIKDPVALVHKANERVSASYDWLGAVTSVLPFTKQRPDKWFCSELIADLLGLNKPWKVTPKKLKRLLERLQR